MTASVDRGGWSGDGDFTLHLIDVLRNWTPIASVRVEDAPTGREGEGFNFLANDVFVTFAVIPAPRPFYAVFRPRTFVPVATIDDLVAHLSGIESIGEPAFHDAGMLQYLHTQRIVGPYQSRGIKLVELVRIYVGQLK